MITLLSAKKRQTLQVCAAGALLLLAMNLGGTLMSQSNPNSLPDSPEPATPEIKGTLLINPGGKVELRLKDKTHGTTHLSNGVELTYARQGECVTIHTTDQTFRLELDGVDSLESGDPFEMVLEPNTQVLICRGESRSLNIEVKAGSPKALTLNMPDGAVAVLGQNAKAEFQWFLDATYYLTGQGAATAVNADGQVVELSEKVPPLVGGPLEEYMDDNMETRFRRKSPVQKLEIYGAIGSPLTLQVEDKIYELIAGKALSIEQSNGARITFTQSDIAGSLYYSVDTGYFRTGIESIRGWKAILLSGQTGRIQWNAEIQTIDLNNTSTEGFTLVSLPSRTVARVAPEGNLQVSLVNNTTFSTAASGADVWLYNELTGDDLLLNERNYMIKSGKPVSTIQTVNTGQKIIDFNWDVGQPLRIGGLSIPERLPPNTTKFVTLPGNFQANINYGADGTITFEVISGDFNIVLSALNGLNITVNGGDSILLGMNRQNGTFTVGAAGDNSTPVNVFTPDGSALPLDPSQALNFNIGDNNSLFAVGPNGNTIMIEGAGADANTGSGNLLGTPGEGNASPLNPDQLSPIDPRNLDPVVVSVSSPSDGLGNENQN